MLATFLSGAHSLPMVLKGNAISGGPVLTVPLRIPALGDAATADLACYGFHKVCGLESCRWLHREARGIVRWTTSPEYHSGFDKSPLSN
jgi:hypothetical protein